MYLDLYRMCNDPARENEALQMHSNFSQTLLKDHFQSSEMPEHALISWTDGQFPIQLKPFVSPPQQSHLHLQQQQQQQQQQLHMQQQMHLQQQSLHMQQQHMQLQSKQQNPAALGLPS
uniref:MAU2 chromatid cohesion factor n=1 Tax=Melanaphis sacchari TaxID=742174 RepID=A0A2H8TPW0_9HEMI